MAEKRVSVRLAAVGGRQVRAELEGVGEAGSRGFGRLSQEMEAANARLAAFSRRVRVAAAAAVAAATAAGVAMVRSGLQTVDAQAKLAQSLGTTVASIQTLERAGELAGVSMSGIEQATKDLTRRLSQAAAGTGPAADALDRLGLSANELIALPLDQRVGAINAAIESFVPAAERAAVAGQLFGEEGSIAMSRIDTATLRQATEDVLAFGVVVSEQDADQIERTNDAISRLGLIWRGLSNQLAVAAAPALEAVANGMAAVASRTGPLGIAIRGLFDNIGRLTTYAATFAAFLAGRWVAGMAAAALSVRGLATALVVLRGALIRTGIGALIVGAGELVYQLTRLVSGAGGFGEAMSLLKDVAVEVWERIRMGAAAAGAAATAMFFDLKADAASGMQSAIESVVGFGNTAANTFEGAYEAIKAIWGLLPAAIGDLAFQAANSLVDGVEAMLNGVVSRINGFIGGINQGLEALGSERRITLVPDLDLGEIENRFEGAASAATTAAQAAFDRAFEDNPLTAPDLGLTDAANRALESANVYRSAARDLAEGARAPLRRRRRGQRHHHGPRRRELSTVPHPGRGRYRPRSVAGPEGHVMAFHEVRFPDNISRGARGGPERRTQIVELASGDEERNASWANSRRRYDVAYGIRRADDLAAVVAFFEARNGRLHGFRFKDWGDHKSCLPSATPSPTDQSIGTGDGTATAFQLVKRYASGAQSWTRAIAKPVAGSVRIALAGVEQLSGWSVDTATGVVTFSAAPGAGVAITAGFEFDVPVRFDTDLLDVTLDIDRLGSITSIPLLELRR